MKLNTKLHVRAAVCGAIALLPFAAFGQTTPTISPTTTTSATTTTNDVGDRDDHRDYGWIGLLGLLGLAGLMPRKKVERYDTTAGRTDVRR